jgi:hypothetical protein
MAMSRRSTRSPANRPSVMREGITKSAYAPGIVVAMELVDTFGNGTSRNPRPSNDRKRRVRAPLLTDAR